jgi:hypothetical protein
LGEGGAGDNFPKLELRKKKGIPKQELGNEGKIGPGYRINFQMKINETKMCHYIAKLLKNPL